MQFEWPGAGICRLNSDGLYEFCLLRTPEPAQAHEAALGVVLQPRPVPLWKTVIEIFWRLAIFAWLAVCLAGICLVGLKVIRKVRSAWKGTRRVAAPLRLATTLVFAGAIGTAVIFLGGGYQLYRLDRAERQLGDRLVAESEAMMECQKSSGIILPNGELDLEAIKNGNPCTIKGDTRTQLGENLRKMRFIDDWTRPVGLTLFLLFCSPWLFSWAFRRRRKSLG